MAFTYPVAERSFITDNAAPSHTISVAPTAGSLLIASCFVRAAATGAGNAITAPAGWTTLSTGSGSTIANQAWFGYKIATGAETAVTPTLSGSGANTDTCITYMEIAGWTGTPTLDASGEDETNIDTAVTSQSAGSATATTTAGLAVAIVGAQTGSNWFTGTSWSNSFVQQSDGGNNSTAPGVWVATLEYASSGLKTTTQTTTDTGDEAYGAIALFRDVPAGNTVTITDITDNRVYQRNASTNNQSITISGTYSGTPTAIQARIVLDGTSTEVVTWTTIDASPSGGVFSGSITVPEGGWYNAQVRYSNDTGIVSNGTNGWGVGVLIGTIGQSNIENWFTDGSGQSPNALLVKYQSGSWATLGAASNGATAFGNSIITGMTTPIPVGLVNYSLGGTALRLEADSGSGYWEGAHAIYTNFTSAVTALGGSLEFIVFGQGERDARSGLVTEAEYQSSLSTFITTQLRTDITNASTSTNLPIILRLLGRGTDAGDTDTNFQAVRNAEEYHANSTADVYRWTTIDLALSDTIHLSAAAYTTDGTRAAQVVLDILGEETYHRGPIITNWKAVTSTQTDINISHNGGTDFTPTTAITEFQVLDNGTPVTVSAAVRQTATSIRLTHTAIVGTETVRYMYGANPTVTGAVLDNSALTLPLEGEDSISELVSSSIPILAYNLRHNTGSGL